MKLNVLVLAGLGVARASNYVDGTCVTDFDASANVDYFPDKSYPTDATTFTVEYFNTYKVVTNSYAGTKVVMYQCGTTEPSVSDATLTLSVPITKAAVTSTTYITYIEMLGERAAIDAYAGSFSYVSSACLQEMYTDGLTAQAYDDSTWSMDTDMLVTLGIEASIADMWSTSATNAYVVTPEYETTVLGAQDHIKAIAYLFNREAEAEAIHTAISDRYECTAENAVVDLEDAGSKPRVLWAAYSEDYSGNAGWSISDDCPQYYCETVAAAKGDLIRYSNVTGTELVWSFYYYLSDAQFLERATLADVLIYTGDFSVAYTTKSSVLDQLPAVAAGRVWDTYGAGATDWFESRIAQPDVLLQDVAAAIWPDSDHAASHTKVYLRDPFNDPIGDPAGGSTCDDYTAAYVDTADECDRLSPAAPGATPSFAMLLAVAGAAAALAGRR